MVGGFPEVVAGLTASGTVGLTWAANGNSCVLVRRG